MAFIVAHELGHIAHGHLANNESLFDVSLQESTSYQSESLTDIPEREADSFALNLMGGSAVERTIAAWPSSLSSIDLAVVAREAGHTHSVEGGHLILRYAFTTKRWPESMEALNYLTEDMNADVVIHEAARQHLDLDLIAEDVRDFVGQLSGLG